MGRVLRSLLVALILTATAVVPATAAPAPIPVVYDSDLDFDDAATLAFLCQEHKHHKIELRAVTVVNSGAGTPGRSLTHARGVLERCGLANIPVAEDSPTGVHPAPPEGREMIERVVTGALHDADRPYVPAPVPAVRLIQDTVRAAKTPVTVVATGPLTNVAKALDSLPPNKIRRVQAMGGAFGVPGNLWGSTAGGFDNTQEFNVWLDPGAAAKVFALPGARAGIVPLNATNRVPVRQSYVDELGATARTAEARLVYDLFSQPDMPPQIADGLIFWWDPVATVSLFRDEGIVEYRIKPTHVLLNGPSSGRTEVARDGVPQRIGLSADPATFERVFRQALNSRER